VCLLPAKITTHLRSLSRREGTRPVLLDSKGFSVGKSLFFWPESCPARESASIRVDAHALLLGLPRDCVWVVFGTS